MDPTDEKIACLFWNLNKKNRIRLLCELVEEREIDIVVLAEGGDASKNLSELKKVDSNFHQPTSEIERLQVVARNPAFELNEVYADISKRLTIRSLNLNRAEVLFVVVHLIDNLAQVRQLLT